MFLDAATSVQSRWVSRVEVCGEWMELAMQD